MANQVEPDLPGGGFPCGITPEVNLIGKDGNAFSILGHCQRAARKAGVPPDEIGHFMAEATGGDYDNVLATAMRYFEVN